MACELIKAARDVGEQIGGLESVKRGVNKYERGAMLPGDLTWLLYQRIFPELVDGAGPRHARVLAADAVARARELTGGTDIDAVEAAARARGDGEILALTAILRTLKTQMGDVEARLVARLPELLRDDEGEGGR